MNHPASPRSISPGLTRRTFLATSSKAAALTAATAAFVSDRPVLGANETLGVGFIGVGGRGRYHLDTVLGMINQGEKLRVVGISDTYGARLRAAAEHAQAKAYPKYPELLADRGIDLVCIATPDRLHVPQALEAIGAGKDVYCEKPMGHWTQFALSKKFFQETRRLGRVVQIGNQANSSSAWPKVAELVRQGALGRVQHVQAGFYRNGDWGERMPIVDPKVQPGPDLDWEGFLGDAPRVPFDVYRFFSWRLYLDYAGGPCTDLFPHVLTPFLSTLGLKYPAWAVASGGVLNPKYEAYDGRRREVPDTFNLCLEYPERVSVVLVCTLSNEFNSDPVIRGDEGTLVLEGTDFGSGFDAIRLIPAKGEPTVIRGGKPNSTLAHWRNFLHCVRTREKPVSDVEFGFQVQTALNMGMLAYLEKKVARFDLEQQDIRL